MNCFLCGRPAFFVSVNTKNARCEYRITKCPGHIKLTKEKRYASLSTADLRSRMAAIGEIGRAKISSLMKDEEYVKSRGSAISDGIQKSGGRSGRRNPNFDKKHSSETREKMRANAKNRPKEFYERNIQTRIANGYIVPLASKPDFVAYKQQVLNITRRHWLENQAVINPLNLVRGSEYELDHQFSIVDGFNHSVPPEVIGHWVNLKLLPKKINRSKHSNSSISKAELLRRYQQQ